MLTTAPELDVTCLVRPNLSKRNERLIKVLQKAKIASLAAR